MFYDCTDSGSYTESIYGVKESGFQKFNLRQRAAVNMENHSIATQMARMVTAMR